jgi:hypothetical protein
MVQEAIAMAFKKTLLYGGGLLLAMTGPMSLFTASDLWTSVRKNWLGASATAANSQPTAPSPAATSVATEPGRAASFSLAGQRLVAAIPPTASASTESTLPTTSMAEAFNFDVTVDWVTHRWPRVSSGLGQMELQGYRVPLVTGTSPADLAGSLTYYFNSRQQVERIAFRGVTGDASALVALLTSRYRFTRRLTNDPGVILYEAVDSSNRSAGTAKIRSASVIKTNQPRSRFEVELALVRPE